MPTLSGHGVTIELPKGWDGRIYRRPALPAAATGLTSTSGVGSPAVLQAANFPLPVTTGDFGGGAVEFIRPGSALVVLFEYPGSAGQPLFAAQGLELPLLPADFGPNRLQRVLSGHVGLQRFFTVSGRAFSLYIVLGDQPDRGPLAAGVSDVLRTLNIAG